MGWIFVDDDDKKESMRNNTRENMREKMMRMSRNTGYRMYDGNRDNYHDEEWCKGYEQGWKDCEERMAEKNGFRNGSM